MALYSDSPPLVTLVKNSATHTSITYYVFGTVYKPLIRTTNSKIRYELIRVRNLVRQFVRQSAAAVERQTGENNTGPPPGLEAVE